MTNRDLPAKPEPTLSPLNRSFWEGGKAGKLMLQQCVACGHTRFPFGPVCTVCLSPETAWREMSGRGEVLCHLVFHQVYNRAWTDDVPYSVVMVQLEEGPRLFSNIADPSKDDVEQDLVGAQVTVVFKDISETTALPLFKVVGSQKQARYET